MEEAFTRFNLAARNLHNSLLRTPPRPQTLGQIRDTPPRQNYLRPFEAAARELENIVRESNLGDLQNSVLNYVQAARVRVLRYYHDQTDPIIDTDDEGEQVPGTLWRVPSRPFRHDISLREAIRDAERERRWRNARSEIDEILNEESD